MKILYNNKSFNIEKIKQKSEYFNILYNSILINDNDELDLSYREKEVGFMLEILDIDLDIKEYNFNNALEQIVFPFTCFNYNYDILEKNFDEFDVTTHKDILVKKIKEIINKKIFYLISEIKKCNEMNKLLKNTYPNLIYKFIDHNEFSLVHKYMNADISYSIRQYLCAKRPQIKQREISKMCYQFEYKFLQEYPDILTYGLDWLYYNSELDFTNIEFTNEVNKILVNMKVEFTLTISENNKIQNINKIEILFMKKIICEKFDNIKEILNYIPNIETIVLTKELKKDLLSIDELKQKYNLQKLKYLYYYDFLDDIIINDNYDIIKEALNNNCPIGNSFSLALEHNKFNILELFKKKYYTDAIIINLISNKNYKSFDWLYDNLSELSNKFIHDTISICINNVNIDFLNYIKKKYNELDKYYLSEDNYSKNNDEIIYWIKTNTKWITKSILYNIFKNSIKNNYLSILNLFSNEFCNFNNLFSNDNINSRFSYNYDDELKSKDTIVNYAIENNYNIDIINYFHQYNYKFSKNQINRLLTNKNIYTFFKDNKYLSNEINFSHLFFNDFETFELAVNDKFIETKYIDIPYKIQQIIITKKYILNIENIKWAVDNNFIFTINNYINEKIINNIGTFDFLLSRFNNEQNTKFIELTKYCYIKDYKIDDNCIIKVIKRSKDKLNLVNWFMENNYIFSDVVLSEIVSNELIEWIFETKQNIGYLTLRNIVSVLKNIKYIEFLIQNNYKFDENIMEYAVATKNIEIVKLLHNSGYLWKKNSLQSISNNSKDAEIVYWANKNNIDTKFVYKKYPICGGGCGKGGFGDIPCRCDRYYNSYYDDDNYKQREYDREDEHRRACD